MIFKTYSELSRLSTFSERYKYLRLNGKIGEASFGFDRFVNQQFYKSREWFSVRDYVIIRDNACDLGVEGYEIYGKILVHHMNPILLEDIKTRSDFLLNPEYLVVTTHSTHNAIHYGDEKLLISSPIERRKNDTSPWKH